MRGERKTRAYLFILGYRIKDMDTFWDSFFRQQYSTLEGTGDRLGDSTGIGNPDQGLLGVMSCPLRYFTAQINII